MFTGIIQGVGVLLDIEQKNKDTRVHHIKFPHFLLDGLICGASVANNGVCLTVTGIVSDKVSFDVIHETLRVTNLGCLSLGDQLNLERSMKLGDEVGGHLMSGHVITTAKIINIIKKDDSYQIWFQIPNKFIKYLFYKGFIGIDGISLTLVDVGEDCFCVSLIPETLERTTLGRKRLTDTVNIEIDSQTQAVVDTVERVLSQRSSL